MPHRKNQVVRICPGCGNSMSFKASCKQVFCSKECRHKHFTIVDSCPQCGILFERYKSSPRKYCSFKCEMTARNLTDANPSYYRDICGSKNPMYGKGQKGSKNGMFGKTRELSPTWKGGRKIRKDGYILVYAPEHPNNCDGYVLEHRLIIEKHLGRYLAACEVVHHVDENKSNNKLENLKLFNNQSEHLSIAHPNVTTGVLNR